MSKIRTVKPEFWTSEHVTQCSITARLLFIGLWNFCDDAGVHPASHKRLKMEVFPGDNCTSDDIKKWVGELTNAELIHQYEADNKLYWQVKGWHHQRIDRPYFKYPQPKQNIDTIETADKQCLNDVSMLSGRPRKGKEGKGINICRVDNSTQRVSINQDVVNVFSYWQTIFDHPKAKLDNKRKQKIEKALKLYSMDDLKKAIDGCSKSKFHLGMNDSGTKYDGIELIFRDAEHVEKFIALAVPAQTHTPIALDD